MVVFLAFCPNSHKRKCGVQPANSYRSTSFSRWRGKYRGRALPESLILAARGLRKIQKNAKELLWHLIKKTVEWL